MRKQRVLLLSEGFGSGHTQAARAIAAGIKQLSPSVSSRIFELGSFIRPRVMSWITDTYRNLVIKQPKLVGLLYKSHYKKSINKFGTLALHHILYTRTATVIKQLKPDLIVCTHPMPNAVISRLKQNGLKTPLITVITDYDAHGTWIAPEVTTYQVSSRDVKVKLMSKGVPANRILTTGIPVHPTFWTKGDRLTTLSAFKLRELPTVLIMGGGWGMSDPAIMDHIIRWREQVQLIFICGSNEKVRLKLENDGRFQHENVRVLGFTKEISKWMDVADILITKPGGMTCTEGMAKGIPMLFYSPIPGQEDANCQYFINRQFADSVQSTATIDKWFAHLANDYEGFVSHYAHLRERSLYYQPDDCAKAIVEMLAISKSTIPHQIVL